MLFWKITGSLAFLALLAVPLLLLLQRKLLFFPETSLPSERLLSELRLQAWPSSGAGYRGLLYTGSEDKSAGTIVLFHGNAGAAIHRAFYLRALLPQKLRVILAEHPGYGGRGGTLSEASLIKDAQETLRLAHREFGGPLYVWGESLGCGVSAGAVSDPTIPVAGLVLLTPWDTLPRVARSHFPLLPEWLVLDRFDSIRYLRDFKAPIAVLVADKDEVIPKKHGLALYEALQGTKKLWLFPHATHNGWPSSPGEAWWNEVFLFLRSSPSKEPK